MRLYHHPISSNSRRVMMAAIHLDVRLDLTEISLMDAGDRRRLAELNPNGMLPVLQDGQFILWESCAIMQYLADTTAGGAALYPRDPAQRADVNRWMLWACQHFAPAISVLTWENIWKGMTGGGARDPLEVARGTYDLTRHAAVLDRHLRAHAWVAGDALSLADFALAAPLMYTRQARLPLDGYIHLAAWHARIRQLPAWRQTEKDLDLETNGALV
ncbi:UNVERIFIED_ORG: glutathione S-transferase [Zoogloea ramigera]|uniref:Glutathione S-transferase family protein n=1 Tax=Duganella zoogloeoides TaxID=75659 RepID=A0ABZ0XYI8_9BURK|nr:glutathione S-transferase family protein [Duganella zoogloeoides]WQH04810.1 glutathione S-transferase family protein [Duganella zoogloeoides]